MLKTLVLVIAAALGLTTPVASGDNSPERGPSALTVLTGIYSKDAPYVAPRPTIKTPPDGYAMVFIETIGRHGSRASTSDADEKEVLEEWEEASDEDALTPLGESLGPDVESFRAAEEEIGYGNLSTRGRAEWQGIGARTAANYPTFFKSLEDLKWSLDSISTTVYRTKQSVAALESGLIARYPNLNLGEKYADKDLVNFDSSRSRQGSRDLRAIMKRPDVVTASTNVLKRVYTDSYVEALNDPVEKALELYALYCIAAGMSEDTDVTFDEYFDKEDAALLGYARDAEKFYKYGPGVEGENGTYEGAELLLDDFFDALDARVDGGSQATVFRVAHGETTMPFAALLQLPGSEKQAAPGVPYTYDNNPWRGDKIGGMAGNIEWVAYQHLDNESVVVTMRYNEKPIKFRSECRPISEDNYFYTPTELERCLPTS